DPEVAARRDEVQGPAVPEPLHPAELLFPLHDGVQHPASQRRRARQDGFHRPAGLSRIGVELKQAQANGLRFAFLEAGSGPTVLLLHGYPDNAYSWERQIPALTAAGYRVVAPFLRGYPPTEIPAHGYYDRGTLALDVKSLIDVLNAGEPVLLVAQDW